MELWIRSQDREELLKFEEICVRVDQDGFAGIWSYGSNKDLRYYLGTYETKERALEVLDEIQSRLDVFVNSEFLKSITDVSKQVYIAPFIVYEMPKK